MIKKLKLIIQCIFFLSLIATNVIAQDRPGTLSKNEALEDLKWLRFSLEYCHPRLYKFDDKKTVDARFDSLSKLIGNEIEGLDFLGLVNTINASVHCGHLYTIPQGKLEKEVLEKKVLPFYVRIVDNKIYVTNNCRDPQADNNSYNTAK